MEYIKLNQEDLDKYCSSEPIVGKSITIDLGITYAIYKEE